MVDEKTLDKKSDSEKKSQDGVANIAGSEVMT
jgi:hypothetical protein